MPELKLTKLGTGEGVSARAEISCYYLFSKVERSMAAHGSDLQVIFKAATALLSFCTEDIFRYPVKLIHSPTPSFCSPPKSPLTHPLCHSLPQSINPLKIPLSTQLYKHPIYINKISIYANF